MTHLDEGTIHAWIDGELDAAQAAEVSQHAATCAECGALVAEARGFIAGASRILTSLDDVPAGVTPKRAPAASTTRPARNYWQAAPWVTGIAAALILAIGIKEWRDRPSAKAAFAPVPPMMDSLRATPVPEAKQVDAAIRPREQRALGSVDARPPAPSPRQEIQLRGAVSGAGVASGAGAGAATEAARVRDSRADIAAESPPRAQSELMKKDALPAGDALQPSAKLVPAAPAPTAVQPLGESLIMRARRDERLLAGCYRFPSELALESREIPVAAKGPAREPAGAPRRLASPAAAQAAPVAMTSVPSIVRLDTTMTSLGRVISSPLTGEAIGTWRLVEGDSIRLHVLVVPARVISASERVACPVPRE